MRKLLVFLIALVLLVAACAFAASADTQPDTIYCKRCNKNVPATEWMEWTATSGNVNTEGHYYLADTFTAQESTVNIPALKFVCLDLRGNTWITEDIQTLTISGDLSILDTVGGGRILTTGANGVSGGFAYVGTAGALNLFGGTVQFVPKDGISIKTGGLIAIDAGTVNVDGGTVTGGLVAGTSSANIAGGNFYLSNGAQLNIMDGVISKGMAITGDNKQGGNIYATGASAIAMTGGIVEDGFASTDGGNIFTAGATLRVSGGVIRNGVSPNRGGNIGAVSSEANLIEISGGTITGGVSGGSLKTYKDETDDSTLNPTVARGEYGGSNIYGRTPSGSLVITGGTIDGDILLDYMGTLTLSGTPKINLGKSNGLRINNNGIKADVSGLQEGAMIYVQANSVFTKDLADATAANAALSYFRGAVRSNISATTEFALTCAQGTQGYCPHCGELVTWTAGTKATSDGQHIYLSSGSYANSNLVIQKDMVLDLNGYTLNRDGGRVIVGYDCTTVKTLSILDSWGGGKMEGTRIANADGGILYIYANGALELYSGTIRTTTSVKDSTAANIVTNGGVIYSSGNVTLHGGRITGGITGVTSEKYGGGNIVMTNSSKKLLVNGGLIQSGNYADSVSLKGGNIYSAGVVEIKGGYIMGGTAATGGNIYSTKEVKMSGGVVWGGTSSGTGGNIYANKLTMSGGLIGKGTSTAGSGGNLSLTKATSTISGNAVIVSGKASSNAGNIYCLETLTLNIEGGLIAGGQASIGGNYRQNAGDCVVNLSGGMVAMGHASGNGGNFYINNGTFRMTGGVITAGTAAAGGNVYMNNNVYGIFKDDGNTATALPVVSYGTATGGNGGNIVFMATGNSSTFTYNMQLGNCQVYAGSASGSGNNIYVNNKAVFEVLPEYAQNTTVYVHADLIQNEIYLNNAQVFCNGLYSGTLLLENRTNLPKVITTQADPTLVIGQAALVLTDGEVRWYGSNADAVAAYTQDVAYIQPGSGEVALPAGTFVVDLAGQNVTLTGNEANVYCFDSANMAFTTFGTATVSGPALKNTMDYTVDGELYITVAGEQENTYSFHYLDMRVSEVTLRPGTAGVYYSCTWDCDATLKQQMKYAGVAVSITDMPGTDFATDADTMYTQVAAADLQNGEGYNSVLVNNIFSESATNNEARGETSIYATPYVTFQNGESLVCAGEVKHSLQTVLQLVDKEAYYANKPALETFHQKWKTAMENWVFANIGVKPQDDNVLRILMGGNSFAYYYVEELYGLLMENLPEGVTEVEIYNFYYSGRGFYTHYNRWINKMEGDYDLFRTDKNGRVKLQPNGAWTLEEVLAVANWDYIGMQGTGKSGVGSYADSTTWEAYCADLAIYAEALLGYVHEMFPYTQLLWHRTWAQEVGRVTDSGFVYTEEYNERYDPGMQYICDFMTEVFDQDKPYDLIQVNSGAAWKEARRLNAELIAEGGEEAGLLPYGGLCAMLARNTYGDKRPGSGDGQHDGDIGGGQLTNAYMWYMTITGDSDLTDNNYKPDYEMSDGLWNMLKQAAMTTYETYYLK